MEPATERVRQTHRGRRLTTFQRIRQNNYGTKKETLERWRIRKAMERVVTVPFELSHLRSTYAVEHEERVYDHRELAALGIKTINWDGK